MNKFKVGDRVKFIDDIHFTDGKELKNQKGTVLNVEIDSVDWEPDNKEIRPNFRNFWSSSRNQLIKICKDCNKEKCLTLK